MLVLAEREDWPERAQMIGRLLRDMMEGESVERSLVGGLNSLIYLQWKGYAHILSLVLVANAGKYIHWMPTMDKVMTSKDELLTKVFGLGSIDHRKQIAAYLSSKGFGAAPGARDGVFRWGLGSKLNVRDALLESVRTVSLELTGALWKTWMLSMIRKSQSLEQLQHS